jgi:hypothetical protein
VGRTYSVCDFVPSTDQRLWLLMHKGVQSLLRRKAGARGRAEAIPDGGME